MKIENLDIVVRLSYMRDLLFRMKRLLSEDNQERRIRVQLHVRADDVWDGVSADDRLLELVEQAIDVRIKEVEQELMEID